MISRTHDVAAITALGVVYFAYPPTIMSLATLLVALVANQIGGIVPDIDQPTAPLWRNLPVGGVVGKIFGRLLGGHRFLTHSILGLALFGLTAHALLAFMHPIIPSIDGNLVWWAFMIGMVSHLMMDTFTKEGVPWLLPVPVKFGIPPIRRLRITTGKVMEKCVVLPVLLLVDVWLCTAHYGDLLNLLHNYVR